MFTGIIETLGTIQEIKKDKDNVHITIASAITNELKIDQSIACLLYTSDAADE